MKKQLTKKEKALIAATCLRYGVSPKSVRIINGLPLIDGIDAHIVAMMPKPIPSAKNARLIANGIKFCKVNNNPLTDDDKLHILMAIDNNIELLKKGELSKLGMATLSLTLSIGVFVLERYAIAGKQVGATDEELENMRKVYNETFSDVVLMLDTMNARFERVGRYVADGDSLKKIQDTRNMIASLLDIITVADWFIVVDNMIKQGTKDNIERAKRGEFLYLLEG